MRDTHLMQQLLQFLLQLHEVPGGHQAILGLVQTVSGELHQLVLNESKHTISQGQSGVRGTLCNDVEQPTLHLGRRLRKTFFVDVIHHDNLIVKHPTGPSRAETA